MNPVVTVGLDGSPESLSATHWAAQEAESRGATLRLLHAWVLLSAEPAESIRPDRPSGQNYWAEHILREALGIVEEHHPGLPVVEDLVAQDPVHALLDAAAESELLVLGSRDMAPLASYFLGDIGLSVMSRCDIPTALVRAREDTAPVTDDGDVVVALGLHGPCDELFAFAFETASRRGVALRAVHGRNLLPAHAYTRRGQDPDIAEETAKDARQELAEALRPWREKFPDVPTTSTVAMESPARAVVRGAVGAGLLVAGRRRTRPAFAPRVGHVLSAAVHHAACPVMIVPHG
ncbi:universal stress protein [Streptomyces sp. NBC_01429]|uniref:universal stress protein n=1 Tax=Streptomyces sp. NBC_01429 TaxID=2903862 RepID=UPI002E2BAFA0|nr:universal stress protein [Streptomyces sp. NBC_01429]